jgi:hypothetical protein
LAQFTESASNVLGVLLAQEAFWKLSSSNSAVTTGTFAATTAIVEFQHVTLSQELPW